MKRYVLVEVDWPEPVDGEPVTCAHDMRNTLRLDWNDPAIRTADVTQFVMYGDETGLELS